MSLPSSWRQFQLFDFVPIKDPNYGTNDALYSDSALSSITASLSYLIVCTSISTIKIVAKDFTLLREFTAYDAGYAINFAACLPNSNLLVTLAERQGSPAILKLWDMNKILRLTPASDSTSKSTGTPSFPQKNEEKSSIVEEEEFKHKYHTQVLIHNGDNSFPVSCFEFNESLTCIAIGYTNGKVILVRGDLVRDRGSKQRVIFESNDPITGVNFNNIEGLLYITTTSKILTVPTTGRNQGKPNRILSKSNGVDLHCSHVDPVTQELISGTTEAIKFYNHVSKTNVINFNLPKKRILKFTKNYLLIISVSEEMINNNKKSMTKILVLDLYNKHVSFTLTIPNNFIKYVFEWIGDLYLLATDGTLYKIHEKSINQQIELILQRELFPIATKLAKQANLDSKLLLRIERLHGFHLYDKSAYEDSIKCFISCLSLFGPNQHSNKSDISQSQHDDDSIDDFIMEVITKFKDPSNITNLTKFLYELYQLKLANNDHVTLLLCCYCKLKVTDDLDRFVDDLSFDDEGGSEHKPQINAGGEHVNQTFDTPDVPNYDLQQLDFQLIINLFRECGYFAQVIRLLHKLNQPNLIVEIQLTDLHQPQQALKYSKTLPIDDLLLILIDHSKNLLEALPLETTELLINVFTGSYKPSSLGDLLSEFNSSSGPQPGLNPDHDEHLDAQQSNGNTPVTSVALNSYQAFVSYISRSATASSNDAITGDINTPVSNGDGNNEHLGGDNGVEDPTYLPPKPKLIFSSFINNPHEFVIFLEACIETFDKYQGNVNDKKDLLITLLEMYLSLSSSSAESQGNETEAEEWHNKALALIKDHSSLLNQENLLLISHMYGFTEGEILAKKGSGNFEEGLFRSATMAKNVKQCFEILEKYGVTHPNLYKLMLKFIVSSESIFEQVSDSQFKQIVNKLRESKLVSPLELVTILSDHEFITIGLIKDYLIEHIDLHNKEINNNMKLIHSYELESTKNSHKLTELVRKPFTIQNNKCSECQLRLDFPLVHFKCKHSYHQRCLNENNYLSEATNFNGGSNTINNTAALDNFAMKRCPLCIGELDSAETTRASQLASKENYDLFESQLNDNADRFKFISDYLGKGVMENDSVIIE